MEGPWVVLPQLIILLFASEVLTVFVDQPTVSFVFWLEQEALHGQWTWKGVIFSIPFWPLGVARFFYGRTKTLLLNFVSIFTGGADLVLTWSYLLPRGDQEDLDLEADIEKGGRDYERVKTVILLCEDITNEKTEE